MPLSPTDILPVDAAMRLAGDDRDTCEAEGASVVVGNDAMVIITDPQDSIGISGVWNSRRFRLHGPFVEDAAVRSVGHLPGSPHWSWATERGARQIHLFARLPEGCFYLGAGKPVQGEYRDGVMLSAELAIDPELTGEVLARVRPVREPDALPELAWLANIKDDPTAALQDFVSGWIPETAEDLGDFLPHQWDIPAPLAGFFRLARKRPVLLGRQNFITRPDEWAEGERGLVAFGHENQGSFDWLFDPAQADPDVWFHDLDGERLSREHEPMSGFLLQFSLFEAMVSAHYFAYSPKLSAEQTAKVTAALTPMPWKPWRWPNDSQRFFVAPGLIAAVTQEGNETFSFQAAAFHRSVLRPLGELGVPWRRFDG
ncbi:hypothetical protein [Catenulispora yoronensis]|uniref:hypothetical protein n=1 Tax=Catenulispora yoronensis TaxID=450799 RepID=UPI0031DF04CF